MPRRQIPLKHLDAHLIPVEQALLARAAAVEALLPTRSADERELLQIMAGEFREIAAELYWWS